MGSDKAIDSDDMIINKLYIVRDQKVMLDRDLAGLYGVKAIRLREQVKRNKERFPESFMFQLTEEEVEFMVSQNAIPSKQGLGGHLPYVFTEHGVLMLANVLKSELAIKMSIRIIEVFVRLRRMLLDHKDILIKMRDIELSVGRHDEAIKQLFAYLKQFIKEQHKPVKPLGFKHKQ